MPFHIRPSNESLKTAEDTGFSSERRKFSSKQRSSSRIAKERDMLKSKNGFSLPIGNQSQESVNGSTTKSDELVRYMSNLPGYLLRTDRGENIQEKALNVGVLDWSRLENWKHKTNHIPALASKFISFNSSESSSKTATKTHTSAPSSGKLADQQGLLSSSIKASYKAGQSRGANPSVLNVKRFQDSKTETQSRRGEVRMAPGISKSFGKTHSGLLLEREEKRKGSNKMTSQIGNLASNLKCHGVLQGSKISKNGWESEDEKSREESQEFNVKKKDRKHKSTSDMGLPLLFPKNKGVSFDSKKKMNSSSIEAKKKVELQHPDIDVDHKPCHSKRHNIVLLHPIENPQTSSPEVIQHSKPRSFDGNFTEPSESSLSKISLSERDYSKDLCHEIRHSRALHAVAEPVTSSNTMQHSIESSRRIDQSSVLSQTPIFSNKMSSLQSESIYIEKDASDINLTGDSAFSGLKESLDQETAEVAARKGRNSPLNRRFSFSLSRIGRSFSFKEGSTVPQFSSTYVSAKSGPVTSESSDRMDNSSKEKAKGHNRTRSSPLRRLLDPILKHKAANIHHLSETSEPAQGSLGSISFRTMSVSESLDVGKREGSKIKALLQLTIKNGLPLFKFVLNNERNILAAAVKNLASPEKGDSGCNFTFYLVNEIKKKSGSWISQGSKEKGCGYVYNVVGQMKVSSSKITEPGSQDSKKQCMVKEYALLGVEIGQTDPGPPKLIRSRELAAVVVEIPCENLSHEGLYGDENLLRGCLTENRCLSSSGKVEIHGSTTVILPGGIHGSPDKGEPSPLIYRWKSGGLCDCGGWDIGCKLLVLSNQKQSLKSNELFQLFVQEGDEKDRPFFSLVPLKEGLYSVEFNSSITHLQAFFICVATLSHQKLPNSKQMSKMHEEIAKEPNLKNNDRIQGKAPVKYTPIPPLSPVGRV